MVSSLATNEFSRELGRIHIFIAAVRVFVLRVPRKKTRKLKEQQEQRSPSTHILKLRQKVSQHKSEPSEEERTDPREKNREREWEDDEAGKLYACVWVSRESLSHQCSLERVFGHAPLGTPSRRVPLAHFTKKKRGKNKKGERERRKMSSSPGNSGKVQPWLTGLHRMNSSIGLTPEPILSSKITSATLFRIYSERLANILWLNLWLASWVSTA